jgi:hypothetical protein
METTAVDALRLGGITLRALPAWTFDLGHVNRGLAAHGGPPIDGAGGGDVLRPAEAGDRLGAGDALPATRRAGGAQRAAGVSGRSPALAGAGAPRPTAAP